MKHTYKVIGMSCSGCKNSVESALKSIPEILNIEIDLKNQSVEIEISKHISIEKLKQVFLDFGLHYSIDEQNSEKCHQENEDVKNPVAGNGIFYCPMRCEDNKTYSEPSDCPVCGMDLLEEPKLITQQEYTCPMHPEIIKNRPGDCPICGMDLIPLAPSISAEEKTFQGLKKKMIIATAFSIPVFIISMSGLIPNNPLYKILPQIAWDWIQLVLTLPVVFYACWMFFERAWKSIISLNFNMFTLVGIGTGVAFLFSIIGLLFPDIFPNDFKGENGNVHLYFEATAVILTLVLLGQLLEAKAHSQTSSAIKELMKMAPSEATLIVDGQDKKVSIHEIKKGDLIRVKPGEKIPVDGFLKEGSSSIDESMITGEPIPVDKSIDDKLSAGTINGTQTFVMVAEKVGNDTLLAQIIQMVSDASRSKAPIQKLADTISKYFVPIVLGISFITFISWSIWGPEPAFVYAFVNAIAVLIIACPCALGLATPMSVMVGVGKGAQSGILIKNAEALEKINKIDVLITDKTGTLTEGKPSVESVFTVKEMNKDKVLQFIVSLNQNSEHPLAEAVVKYGKKHGIDFLATQNFNSITGKGVVGEINNEPVAIGNDKLMKELNHNISVELLQNAQNEQENGKTVSFIAINSKVVGYLVISDSIKESSKKAIEEMHQKGIKVIMMTGDNEKTAQSVADYLSIDEFYAGCLPNDKLDKIKKLQKSGLIVAMTGDGINDAPALAQSDIGISMGTGTDVAIESSEITLIKGDLLGIVKAYNLSHSVMRNIKQNLFFAFIYNMLGVPIAAGLLFPVFGILLSPMIAATAMSFSSVSVIANSLRLKKIIL